MGEAERKVKHLDDSKIIELFFERSEQAIIELSKKYGPLCGKIAFNILNSVDDEEECVNDAYLAVWNAIPPQRPEHLGSYVCRIVRNTAIKKYHSNTASKRNGEYDVALDEIEEFIPSPSSVEDELEARELADKINGFLASLDPQSRVMFVKRYYYSESVFDIARLYGIGEHAVSVRLFRIRKKLKKYLIKEGVFM